VCSTLRDLTAYIQHWCTSNHHTVPYTDTEGRMWMVAYDLNCTNPIISKVVMSAQTQKATQAASRSENTKGKGKGMGKAMGKATKAKVEDSDNEEEEEEKGEGNEDEEVDDKELIEPESEEMLEVLKKGKHTSTSASATTSATTKKHCAPLTKKKGTGKAAATPPATPPLLPLPLPSPPPVL
jgi:hypothetical protein